MMISNCLAVIPARGGSKRIPGKNIKEFLSRPIIAYSIEAALQSQCFDEVMVSTDSKDIVEVAKKFGAVVPFIRNGATSNDFAGLADVLVEVLDNYKKLGSKFDYCCCILSTAPFLQSSIIKGGYEILVSDPRTDAVIPVVKYGYPIQRACVVRDNCLEMIWPENYSKRSQDLEPTFHDAGQFYWFRTDSFLRSKKLFLEHTLAMEVSQLEVQDIDTLEDWEIAEIKYRLLYDAGKRRR